MKKVLLTTAILLSMATFSFACQGSKCGDNPQTETDSGWAVTDNTGTQFQVDGGTGTPTDMIGGGAQFQTSEGYGAASEGNEAKSEFAQQQGEFGSIVFEAGDDFTSQSWDASQESVGGGETVGGKYEYSNTQGQAGGAIALTDGAGKFSGAGSAYLGGGKSTVNTDGRDSVANASQTQGFDGAYSVLNQGENGFIYQGGEQTAVVMTATNANGGGYGESTAYGVQGGGSVAYNNGEASYMKAGNGAAGYGHVSTTATKCADAGGSVALTQNHTFEQSVVSADGKAFQAQQGNSSTVVSVGVN